MRKGTAFKSQIQVLRGSHLDSRMVAPTGIEPVSRVPETLILSIELRSRRKNGARGAHRPVCCGDTGIRTPDLLHAMQAL